MVGKGEGGVKCIEFRQSRGLRARRVGVTSFHPRRQTGEPNTHTLGVGMSVQERDPCPHRIFDDIGGAFAMGAIGGGVWNSVKGARNSPRGERLLGSVTVLAEPGY